MTPTIRDYVQHKPDCDTVYISAETCSCGLDEALRRVEELEDGFKRNLRLGTEEVRVERDEALRRVERYRIALGNIADPEVFDADWRSMRNEAISAVAADQGSEEHVTEMEAELPGATVLRADQGSGE